MGKNGEPGVSMVHMSSFFIHLESSREPNSPLPPSGNSQREFHQGKDSNSEEKMTFEELSLPRSGCPRNAFIFLIWGIKYLGGSNTNIMKDIFGIFFSSSYFHKGEIIRTC